MTVVTEVTFATVVTVVTVVTVITVVTVGTVVTKDCVTKILCLKFCDYNFKNKIL